MFRQCRKGAYGSRVRRRGLDGYQSRIWTGDGGMVNLGTYPTPTAARQVAERVLRELGDTSADPLAVWAVARRLAGNGWDVGGRLAVLLPKYVRPDGAGGFGYRVRGGGGGIDRGGFATAEDAYRAAVASV